MCLFSSLSFTSVFHVWNSLSSSSSVSLDSLDSTSSTSVGCEGGGGCTLLNGVFAAEVVVSAVEAISSASGAAVATSFASGFAAVADSVACCVDIFCGMLPLIVFQFYRGSSAQNTRVSRGFAALRPGYLLLGSPLGRCLYVEVCLRESLALLICRLQYLRIGAPRRLCLGLRYVFCPLGVQSLQRIR